MTAAIKASPTPPAGRTLVITGFVLATLFSGVVTCGVSLYSSHYQATRTERAAEVEKFAAAAKAFDPLVKEFVVDVKKGKLTPRTRDKIRDNLMTQRLALEGVESIVDEAAVPAIKRYQSTLTRADTAIKSTEGILKSRAFAQEAVHIAEQREGLLKELRKAPKLF